MGRDFTGSRGESRVGLYEFLRDVLVASIDKRQFPFALTMIILLAVIWKLSPADLCSSAGKTHRPLQSDGVLSGMWWR